MHSIWHLVCLPNSPSRNLKDSPSVSPLTYSTQVQTKCCCYHPRQATIPGTKAKEISPYEERAMIPLASFAMITPASCEMSLFWSDGAKCTGRNLGSCAAAAAVVASVTKERHREAGNNSGRESPLRLSLAGYVRVRNNKG